MRTDNIHTQIYIKRDTEFIWSFRYLPELLTTTSPVTKVPAKRAPELGEHNEEILKELGFDEKLI